MDEYDQMKAQKARIEQREAEKVRDEWCAEYVKMREKCAAMAEALRHADIDLSMLLPEIADLDMQKAVRKTLDMIDALSPQDAGASQPPIGEE